MVNEDEIVTKFNNWLRREIGIIPLCDRDNITLTRAQLLSLIEEVGSEVELRDLDREIADLRDEIDEAESALGIAKERLERAERRIRR